MWPVWMIKGGSRSLLRSPSAARLYITIQRLPGTCELLGFREPKSAYSAGPCLRSAWLRKPLYRNASFEILCGSRSGLDWFSRRYAVYSGSRELIREFAIGRRAIDSRTVATWKVAGTRCPFDLYRPYQFSTWKSIIFKAIGYSKSALYAFVGTRCGNWSNVRWGANRQLVLFGRGNLGIGNGRAFIRVKSRLACIYSTGFHHGCITRWLKVIARTLRHAKWV